jgi:hypothetical protein
MDLSFITELYVPLIIVACLVVGYIFKKWINDVDNKWIPTIVTIFGLVLGGVINGWTVPSLIAGAVSGLASTGLHQLFSQIIEGENRLDN